jgi:hypothetical protein
MGQDAIDTSYPDIMKYRNSMQVLGLITRIYICERLNSYIGDISANSPFVFL